MYGGVGIQTIFEGCGFLKLGNRVDVAFGAYLSFDLGKVDGS
jgi:hypothetical protein